jgi:hypothetical protein
MNETIKKLLDRVDSEISHADECINDATEGLKTLNGRETCGIPGLVGSEMKEMKWHFEDLMVILKDLRYHLEQAEMESQRFEATEAEWEETANF